MSVESIARALWVPDLAAAEKLLLIGIANHDGDGGAWPAMSTLAGYLGYSERHTRRLIAALVERGLVSVEYNAGGTDRTPDDRRPNRYTLHLPIVDKSGDGGTHMSPRKPNGGTCVSERGDILGTDGGTHMSPEPSFLEPSIKDRAQLTFPSVDNSRLCSDCSQPLDESRRTKWRCLACQSIVDELVQIRTDAQNGQDEPRDNTRAATPGDPTDEYGDTSRPA